VQPLPGFVCEEAQLVNVNGSPLRIEIRLRHAARSKARCPVCSKPAAGYDTQPERRWEFIRLWGIRVELLYCPRRVECSRTPECGIKVEAMPWSEGKHHATRALMVFLSQWARRMSWKEVALVYGVSWEMVYRSVAWVVAFGLANRKLEGIRALGVDELHWGRGKKSDNYVTLIYQIDAGCRRLLWVGLKRTEGSFRAGLKELGAAALSSVRFVCSDMWKPFLKVIRTELPEALNILDRFHIAAHLNAAVDNVRRGEVSALKKGAQKNAGKSLKNMRFTFLKRSKNVRGKARVRLNEVLKAKGATARAWLLKEGFQHFWTYRSVDWALGFLDAWVTKALRSRLEPMKKVARMLRTHRELIGNYFRAKKLYNSGVVEGLNLKCNLVKRRAYGLRTFPALKVAFYHNLGALPEPELTHRFC
jgi:transposase